MTLTDARYLGQIDYSKGLEAQKLALSELDRLPVPAIVLGLEHQPVITLGIRGKPDIDLRLPKAKIFEHGFSVVSTDRGGQATLHNPGQLVIYPICNLKALGLGVRDYVCLIEKVTGAWLSSLNVSWSRQVHEPGIFVEEKKLVALGFRISQGKTSHGIAINVENNLEDFELIRTCGVTGQPVTSLAELGIQPDKLGGLKGLFEGWMTHFNASLGSSDSTKRCETPNSEADHS